MSGGLFWAVAAALAALVASVLIGALRRSPVAGAAPNADLSVYRDQLAEVDRDLERGTIGPDEAARLRAEIGKRVLDADRARSAEAKVAGAGSRLATVPALIVAVTLPGALAAYWALGAPGYPDMALQPRLAALDAGIAGRPSQEAELQTLGRARIPALDERLAAELAQVTDPEMLRSRFRTAFEAGKPQEAIRVQERLLAVLGDKAGSVDHANLALVLVAEAGGYVSPEAEAALRASLQADMSNELARYLVGEMFLQGGRFDQAFRFWRPLLEGGTPDAPWTASIRERIGDVAELAGIRYAPPEAAGQNGPTAEDMAAAGDMSPEDRQAMIEGMVAQLSDRLATEGGSVEDWNRLIRSLAVLERLPEAQTIYDEAKTKFEGRPAELSFLRLAAVESGLNP
ncbi:c-type cytochrome biogenesis protein CcmI [Rhodobacter sp. SY28-1]|uniref:c-type cytochrome biogenesis protein CcmI n=1 Tax=Rhodobacter sp. SY28-1 TaxID=2562317 RepID=UPI0014854E62|nr:c-type cytochrome biogenesis protein CcmI [Rhodobacter sp. SY28-1]